MKITQTNMPKPHKVYIQDSENISNWFTYIYEPIARETICKVVKEVIGQVGYEKYSDQIDNIISTSFSSGGLLTEVTIKQN